MEVGENHNGQHAGGGVGRNPARSSEGFQRLGQPVRQDMLPIHPESEAGDCNPQLRSGDIQVLTTRIVDNPPYHKRQPMPLGRQTFDTRAGYTHNGEFRSYKQAVKQDKEENDQNREKIIHRAPPP